MKRNYSAVPEAAMCVTEVDAPLSRAGRLAGEVAAVAAVGNMKKAPPSAAAASTPAPSPAESEERHLSI